VTEQTRISIAMAIYSGEGVCAAPVLRLFLALRPLQLLLAQNEPSCSIPIRGNSRAVV
jgi:hypothetical protein